MEIIDGHGQIPAVRADVSYADVEVISPTKVGHVASMVDALSSPGPRSSRSAAWNLSNGSLNQNGSGARGRLMEARPEDLVELVGRLDGLESRVEELSRTLDRLTQRFDCVQPGDLARRLEEQEARILATHRHLEATEHQLSRDLVAHGNLIRNFQTQFADLQKQLHKAIAGATQAATQELGDRVEAVEAKQAKVKSHVGHEVREAVRKEYERLVLELAMAGPARRVETPSDRSRSLLSEENLRDLRGFKGVSRPTSYEGPLAAPPLVQ